MSTFSIAQRTARCLWISTGAVLFFVVSLGCTPDSSRGVRVPIHSTRAGLLLSERAALLASASPQGSSDTQVRAAMRLPQSGSAGQEWQAGIHYSILLGKMETQAAPGKVEVLELFMYSSPLSYELQPFLQDWIARKPEYIEYRRAPAIAFPHARLQARAFYSLSLLNRPDLHDALFEWIADPKHSSVYHDINHPNYARYLQLTADFASQNGIDRRRFIAAYKSNKVSDTVIDAEVATHAYLVNGTSTLVVNGRYSTNIQRLIYPKSLPERQDYATLFQLIEYLAASERVAEVQAQP